MKIEEVRTSFTVYLIASELNRLEGIAESLGLAGYMAASFNELTSAFSEFPSNPPHFLIFDAAETSFNLRKAIKQVSAQLPESHVFLLTPIEQREAAVALLDSGVYDLIYTPLVSNAELLRALDRAAERDYFMYTNERLAESASAPAQASEDDDSVSALVETESDDLADSEVTRVPIKDTPAFAFSPKQGDQHLSFARALFDAKAPDEALQIFLRAVSQTLDQCGAVFFKYVANRRVLLASSAVELDGVELGGLGVNLNEAGSQFKSIHLRDPMGIPQFADMVREVFNSDDFFAYPVEAMGEIQGVTVFLRAEPGGEQSRMLGDWLMLLNKALSALESERRLHVTAIKDPVTELLNRANFLGKVEQEISRARRTTLPVSLLILAVDAHSQIVSQQGPEEGNTILRVIARIVEKHSRVNDVLGRTSNDEFGILLPHTGHKGAMIKAERLRRLLGSADFSKVLSAFPQVTVSIGVCEYPSHVRDADELMHAADEALFSVRRPGNKTCVAKAPENFTPDFSVQEKDGP